MNSQKDLKSYITVDYSKYNFDVIDYEDRKDIEEIIREYTCKINEPTINESEVLMEQYNILKSRRLPAKDWLVRTIFEISKKDKHKQTVQYLIGILRNRMNYGWGVLRSQEEQLITKRIENMLGQQISTELIEHIYELMGSYGATRIAFAIHEISMEEAFVRLLREELDSQFPQKGEEA